MHAVAFFRVSLFLPVVFFVTVWAAKSEDFRSFDRFRTAVSGVPGWIEKEDKYLTFTPKELYYIIGKGAADFEKQGLKKGISVLFMNGDKILEIYFTDFGKFSRSKNMVYFKKKFAVNPKDFPQINVAPSFCDEAAGGCVVCFAKGNYYVEMTLSGYDTSEKGIADAASLGGKILEAISH
jgi:hypothetical protein